jgi:hypothetical protein
MNDDSRKVEKARVAKLREAMTDADIEQLKARSKASPRSLTLDEVDILFILAKERVRAGE